MTTNEALQLLDGAIADERPSRMNRGLTRALAVQIMRACVSKGVLDRPRTESTIHKITIIEKNVRRVAGDR